jgi:hypothetical protein
MSSTAAGPDMVKRMIDRGKRVFLISFLDTETVRRATTLRPWSGVVDCPRESQSPAAALQGRGDSGLKLLAVTVLTNFDSHDLGIWASNIACRNWPGAAGVGSGMRRGVVSGEEPVCSARVSRAF